MPVQARSPREIKMALDEVVLAKTREGALSLVFLGMLAGIYIGFGAVGATTVSAWEGLPVGLSKFLAASVFCVGLILVIVPGSELFTGNILMSAGLVSGRVRWVPVLRNWIFVYLGNFLGALLLALAMYHSGLLGTPERPTATGVNAATIATAKLGLPFGQAFIRGVLCNMLVCLAVLLAIASRTVTGKVLGIYFPIMTFVLSGFEHSVANMYFLPAGLLAEGCLAGGFAGMFSNLVPVTIGNIAGGLVVVLLHPAHGRRVSRVVKDSITRRRNG